MAKNNNQTPKTVSRDEREKAQQLFRQGLELLSQRRFSDALDVFEKALTHDRRSSNLYAKMGIACLYLDYLEEADRYFGRALQLDRDNTEAMNGRSFLLLRRDDTAEATNLICDILRVDPANRYARRNFNDLNEAENIASYVAHIHPSDFVALPNRFRFLGKALATRRWKMIAVLAILASLVVLAITFSRRPDFRMPWMGQGRRPDHYYPSNLPVKTDLGKSFLRAVNARYDTQDAVLGEERISELLTRLRQMIDSHDYNESRYLVNRLRAAPDTDAVSKRVVSELARFIKEPGVESLRFNPKASEIVEKPYLYRDVHVKWFSRAVMLTNNNFLQVAPVRYYSGDNTNLRVIAIGGNIPRVSRGRSVEIFGSVLGVDKEGSDGTPLLFLRLKRLKQFF